MDDHNSTVYVDPISGDEVYVGVRVACGAVWLVLSPRANGDVEVAMPVDVCRRVSLQLAVAADELGTPESQDMTSAVD